MNIHKHLGDEHIPVELQKFACYEATANKIRQFHDSLVPGFLQTMPALEASIIEPRALPLSLDNSEGIAKLIEFRQARQYGLRARFEAGQGPEIAVVLGEQALRMSDDAPDLTDYLRSVHNNTNEDSLRADIRVLPQGKKLLARAILGNFVLLEGSEKDEPWAIVSGFTAGKTVNNDLAENVEQFKGLFQDLSDAAVDLNHWPAR